MSILIKGVEMPQGDTGLVLVIFRDGSVYRPGILTQGLVALNAQASPVPTPHGRLIDADELITTLCEWGVRLERGQKLTITMCEAKQAIVDIIEDAPTVLEAEG